MNDFTKEELEYISECIICSYRSNPISPIMHVTLYDKIQSMIDTYCEHDISDPLMSLVKKCNKCQIPLAYRPWELLEYWNDNQ